MNYHKKHNLLIFGGSFNPPTVAHENILVSAKRYADSHDMLLVILPSGERPDKTIAIPREIRLELIRKMLLDCQIKSDYIIDTRELDSKDLTETHQTILNIKTDYPQSEQTWIFGADSISTMPDWPNGNQIMKNIKILAIDRLNHKITQKIEKLELVPTTQNVIGVSSTMVRSAVINQRPYADMTGPEVHKFLMSNPNIYG